MVGWVALFGAIVYLDTTAAFQFMICQPLIACPIFGMIVGRPEIGIFFGLTFQLLWLRVLPVGAARFPEGNLGAIVATALAATIPPTDGQASWLILTLATLAGLFTAGIGRHLTPSVRYLIKFFSEAYEKAVLDGKSVRGGFVFVAAIAINITAGALFTLALYFVSYKAMSSLLGVSSQMPLSYELAVQIDPLWKGLFPALIGAGVGVVVARFARRRMVGWTVGGFVVAMGVLMWL
ncbi:PTS sugar transporter subunit IIC [bacterium]|nr:PTS sugar transporter subunit IIC [bacterium]